MSAEKAKHDGLRATRRMMRSLGVAVGASAGGVRDVGKFIAGRIRALGRLPGVFLKRATSKGPPRSREGVRAIVIEELTRLHAAEGSISLGELERRLRLMAETIEALQAKIAELSDGGPVSEADMLQAMGSIKTTEQLTKDEKTILMTVFRQNVALQKPELSGLT